VTAVTVRGTKTPSQVVISWKVPAGRAYAGARVVVVPGATPTADRNDTRAVFAQDVPSPAKTLLWSGSAGRIYSVSVFAYDASASAFAKGATAKVVLPGAGRHLVIANFENYEVALAYLTLPANAPEAIMCFRIDRAPTAPADATRCSDPAPAPYIEYEEESVKKLYFAVFPVHAATGALGPPVSEGDGVLPATDNVAGAFPVSTTSLRFSWAHEVLAGSSGALVDDRRWELKWAPGTASPAGNARAKRVVVKTTGVVDLNNGRVNESFVAKALTPGVPYSFAVRTINSIGEVGPWASYTAATRVRGAYLVDTAGPRGSRRTSNVPAPSISDGGSLAVEADGTAHTAVFESFARAGTTVHGARGPSSAWRRESLPSDLRSRSLLVASRTAPGVLAVTDRWCVRVRSRSGVWTKVGCMQEPDPESTDLQERVDAQHEGADVYGLELDRRGAVHVVYREDPFAGDSSFLMYGTNTSGKWTTRRVSEFTGYGTAALAYDPITDRLVLVTGDAYANNRRHRVRVTSKAPRAVNFDAFSTRYDAPGTRALQPTSIASFGGRITIAARRWTFHADRSKPSSFWGSHVLLTGTSPSTVGGMTPIPGTIPGEGSLGVYAQSRTRVLVGWSHTKFNANAQGAWSAWRTYGSGGPTWTPSVRESNSAYDELQGLGVDAAGRSYFLIVRN
jgi:hypothetical protein